MAAGALRHRISIATRVETKTAAGGFAVGDPTLLWGRVPAQVDALTGRELQIAMEIDPRAKWEVSTRYLQGVRAGHIVTYHAFDGDRTFEIVAPPVVEEKTRMMTLACAEATV